jgi:hypothetical protein
MYRTMNCSNEKSGDECVDDLMLFAPDDLSSGTSINRLLFSVVKFFVLTISFKDFVLW